MNEVPLFDHEHPELGSFRKRTHDMRKKLEDMGVKKDFMLANNEFGLNWHFKSYPGFNRYTLSLIDLEQDQEKFKSGLVQMALWDIVEKGFLGKPMLMDSLSDNRMKLVLFELEMPQKFFGIALPLDPFSTYPIRQTTIWSDLAFLKSFSQFNRYTLSLINLELGLEMFKSGLDSMALWDSVGREFKGKTMLMDKQYDNRMNPVHFGLEMLWKSVGMDMLEMFTSGLVTNSILLCKLLTLQEHCNRE